MTRTPIFRPLARVRMIRELTLFLIRNIDNPTVGWLRREAVPDRDATTNKSKRSTAQA